MPAVVKSKFSLDVSLIKPFVASVTSVMQMMAGFAPTILTPHVKTATNKYSVYGLISFSGGLTGSMSVSLTRGAAEKLVERLTGAVIDASSAEFADAVGEVANMVAGAAKAQIGVDSNITVPTVMVGNEGCQFRPLTGVPCVVIPCSGEIGEFAVEVCIKRTSTV